MLATGPAETANPQTARRVSITGIAEMIQDGALLARYLAVHPYAKLYAGFGDFNLWRITPRAALFVEGFARATRLGAATLMPDPTFAAAIAEQITTALTETSERLDHLTNRAGLGTGWRLANADLDGIDITPGDSPDDSLTKRVTFTQPIVIPEDLARCWDT